MPTRLLLDENLSERLIALVADAFPETTHVRRLGLGGASDDVVWSTAAQAARLLVTKDEDFIAFAVLRGAPPQVVWLNVGNASNTQTAELLRSNVTTIDAFAAQNESTFLVLGLGTRAG